MSFESGMSTVLLYISIGLVALWTARLAWSKGRSPWIWAAAALALAFLPWKVASMAPMVLLLFLRSRAPVQEPQSPPEEGVTCPKCHTHHLSKQNFCVQCGWDLSKVEAPVQAGAPPASAPAPAAAEPRQAPKESAAPTPAAKTEPAIPSSTAAEPPPPVHEAPPPKPPRVHRPPTAAGMTERGMGLVAQGKFQEAVDQFTKAIALDPTFRTAWERRAEAYEKLGRAREAAEDKRKLQALGGQAS